MSGHRIHELYEDSNDFILVLECAEKAKKGKKAAKFVAETKQRYGIYGDGMYLSANQKDWLERLAADVR